jgi:hypothetical protein
MERRRLQRVNSSGLRLLHNSLTQPVEGILASVGFTWYAIAAVRDVVSISSMHSAVDTASPIPFPPSFPARHHRVVPRLG